MVQTKLDQLEEWLDANQDTTYLYIEDISELLDLCLESIKDDGFADVVLPRIRTVRDDNIRDLLYKSLEEVDDPAVREVAEIEQLILCLSDKRLLGRLRLDLAIEKLREKSSSSDYVMERLLWCISDGLDPENASRGINAATVLSGTEDPRAQELARHLLEDALTNDQAIPRNLPIVLSSSELPEDLELLRRVAESDVSRRLSIEAEKVIALKPENNSQGLQLERLFRLEHGLLPAVEIAITLRGKVSSDLEQRLTTTLGFFPSFRLALAGYDSGFLGLGYLRALPSIFRDSRELAIKLPDLKLISAIILYPEELQAERILSKHLEKYPKSEISDLIRTLFRDS